MPKNSLNVLLKGADDIFSTEESRQEQQREQVQQIPIGELFPFKNHPFKVLDDESMGTIPVAFANPLPSLHPLDFLVGVCSGAGLRLAVYLRGKNAKKYRHGMEYGSARCGA